MQRIMFTILSVVTLFTAMSCASGQNFYPAFVLNCDCREDADLLEAISKAAKQAGFQPSEVPSKQTSTVALQSVLLFRFKDSKFPALHVYVDKLGGNALVIREFDASVGGDRFPPSSEVAILKFETELHRVLPGVFRGGYGEYKKGR